MSNQNRLRYCSIAEIILKHFATKLILAASPPVDAIHYTLDDATLTYNSAQKFCNRRGLKLCSHADICQNATSGIPVITGTFSGDKWAPIR